MLQDLILGKVIDSISLTQTIQNSDSVDKKGTYALDATEKNPNIEGTLAEDIANISNKITNVQNTVNAVVALPDGESTASDAEIAAAKVGPNGETYSTLQESIIGQINASKQVAVSNHEPEGDTKADIWVNSSENSESIALPEINDDSVSRVDTWSSFKINKELLSVASSLPSGGGGEGGSFNISDIFNDDDVSTLKGWSSQKIQSELKVISENLSSGIGSVDLSTLIDDVAVSTNRTWSSQYINAELKKKATASETLVGYGITDAKIVNGTIVLGENTITPITSHQDISGKANVSDVLAMKNPTGTGYLKIGGTEDNPGENSVSIGYQNAATGLYSVAIGDRNIAKSTCSVTIGQSNNSFGFNTVAIGNDNKMKSLQQSQCVLIGSGNSIEGNVNSYSWAFGGYNTINGSYVSAMGYGHESKSPYSTVAGGYSNSIGENSDYSAIFGGTKNSVTGTYSSVVGGYGNTIQNPSAGSTSSYSTISGGYTNIVGNSYASISGGKSNRVDCKYGVIGGGSGNAINDINSTALGNTIGGGLYNTVKTHSNSSGELTGTLYATVSGGYGNIANNNYATVIGGNTCTATGEFSVSGSYYSTASGTYSVALGTYVTARYGNTVLGRFNVNDYGADDTSSAQNSSAKLFIIGNGSNPSVLSNAFSVDWAGNTYAGGSNYSHGADYAECFEWDDQNTNNEDRVGKFVTFTNGNKIRIANNDDEYILGVISGNPCVVGNVSGDTWTKMYLRDEYGRFIYEDAPATEFIKDDETGEVKEVPVIDENGEIAFIKRRVLNPDYDSSMEYVNRMERPEWDAVGMVGVLPVTQDGTLVLNGYATVGNDGVATACDKSHENAYRVIKITSEHVAEILFR